MLHLIRPAGKAALITFIVTLFISFAFQFSLAIWFSLCILLIVIFAGILFDIIGTAVITAQEAPFHAMGADRVPGSRQAVYLIRRADKVANYCHDVVGDISGTVGGAMVASIVLGIGYRYRVFSVDLLSAGAIALTAAIAVAGKALGKTYAITNANQVVLAVGKFLALFKLANMVPPKGRCKKSNLRKARK